ncbi:hypothetical protein [Cronobacter phage EspYZU12]|nr:hypothetical protein EspYZU14_185 [Cronobacter phage EspYZU14]WBF78373.1 hypothetical protein [Cronobacter phage EspYZU12]
MPLEKLLQLWREFSIIPVNEQNETEESFLHFEIGSDVLEIWHWFESQNKDFKVADLIC